MDDNLINVENLKPFPKFCYTIGMIPTSFRVTMTYEEQVLELMRFIKDEIIPNVNQNILATKELQEKFVELVNYVNEYFENLDVQEEINNKLNKMAEDGSLYNLIEPYITNIIQPQIDEQNSTIQEQNSKIVSIDNKISSAINGNPLVATSLNDMTDTSKIYVLTTDGKWYYYNGSDWVAGGTYQSAVSSTDVEIVKPLAYTDNAILNEYITQCKIINKSETYVKYYIRFYNDNNIVRIYGIDANENETMIKQLQKSQCYDNESHLLFIENEDVCLKMILNFPQLAENQNGTFQPIAYQINYLFDILNFPNDKYIKIENLIDGTYPLPLRMNLRKAVKGLYLFNNNNYRITVFNGNNNNFLVQLRDENNSIISTGTFKQNSKDIIEFKNYGYIYLDSSILTSNYYGSIPITNTEDYNNSLILSLTNSGKIFYCGQNRELSTLKEGIEEASKFMNSILYVDEGTYNLIEEFGNEYFENMTSGKMYGLILKNNIHIIFSPNSKVISHYEGDNQYACSLYSPFNAGEYGFIIENLTLECSRCRYAIHDERNGSTENYESKYINCNILLDNSIENEYWPYMAVIGGGFGSNAKVTIENCLLKQVINNNRLGYFHVSNDNDNPNHKFIFNFINNYLINGSFGINNSREDASENSIITIINNNFPTEQGTDEQGFYTADLSSSKVVYNAWNNIIR